LTKKDATLLIAIDTSCPGGAQQSATGSSSGTAGEHHHNGIALVPTEVMRYGIAAEVIAQRQQVLNHAYSARNPERFDCA
jgi:hypothetical protein